ncbi:hypothetical protein ABVE96_10375 [Lactiplantibacillus plantarum]|uniref:hypothetical protein n=1 Tax=Lactiplantibacillus plantarum TaxID=1590 RepID=UPI00338D5D6E
MEIEYKRLGILRVGEMYVQGETIYPSKLNFASLLLSNNITDAHLFAYNTAHKLAIKYNGKVIPITLKMEAEE